MQSTTIIAFDQHAATTVAAVLLPSQRTPALHTVSSDDPAVCGAGARAGRAGVLSSRRACRPCSPCGPGCSAKALELADDKPLPAAGHVFCNELGERVQGFKTAWRNACRKAKITGVTFHDLRREAASQLLETPGVDLSIVRDFLGHHTVQTTNTYLSTSLEKRRTALAKRDAARTNLAQPPVKTVEPPAKTITTH